MAHSSGDGRGRAASLVATACRKAKSIGVDELIDRIGLADRPRAVAAAHDAWTRGMSIDALLGAAWLAPLRWGGLPSDVHAVLVLPAIGSVVDAALKIGVDPWPAVAWAVSNASEWSRRTRTGLAKVVSAPLRNQLWA